ncbi:MAG TPA: lipoyl(octanoyl) transferase LipB [Candidatus Omnitrophota bacterium]|nr:lipoyl(octanoyl) transferase LipB [Candidatus Omnitrophota bacterium]HPT07563.1 lipoyl(octanoyl) transferase LipB [Candidatus Omnitrophota bacterium]
MHCHVIKPGIISLKEGVRLQNACFDSVCAKAFEAALILCQHSPVITYGRRAGAGNILFSPDYLFHQGIEVLGIDRGGDVTYHGPGQLVVYPIFPLDIVGRDLHRYLRNLEEVILRFLSSFGIPAQRRPGLTGVWIEDKKIASVGISVRRWVSFHGFSINIEDRGLSGYRFIRPCGMDLAMTSLAAQRGSGVLVENCLGNMLEACRHVFGVTFCQEEDLPWQK